MAERIGTLLSKVLKTEAKVKSDDLSVDGELLLSCEIARRKWSMEIFPEATAQSALKHLKKEVIEIEQDLQKGIVNAEEYADALMCLFDSASRAGISITQLVDAFAKKQLVNMQRTWVKNDDNTYSHVKEEDNKPDG